MRKGFIAGGLLVIIALVVIALVLAAPDDGEPVWYEAATSITVRELEASAEAIHAATLDEQMRRGVITPIYGTPPATYTAVPPVP
jgi:hypothetical protein